MRFNNKVHLLAALRNIPDIEAKKIIQHAIDNNIHEWYNMPEGQPMSPYQLRRDGE